MNGGFCDFCDGPGGPFVLDHDHGTGRIRGTVHPRCNQRIGSWTKANVHLLLEYLNRDAELGTYENPKIISLTRRDLAAIERIMDLHPECRTRHEAIVFALKIASERIASGAAA